MDSLIDQLNIGIQMLAIGIVVWFAFCRRHFFLYMIAAGGLMVVGAIAVSVLYPMVKAQDGWLALLFAPVSP